MAYGLGVDLGTTWTAAAVRRGDKVETLLLGGRRPEIPSVLYLPADGPVLVGEPAVRRGEQHPDRMAREFKRRLGDPVPVLVGGVPHPPQALLSRQLSHVLEVAATAEQGPPAAVVLTCPANWGPYKRELLEQAARTAGAPAVVLRTEPEAAAVEYAAGEHMADGDIVAVYDLGGGTFDAAVLRRTAKGFDLLGSPAGLEQLGGADFDEAVFEHVVAQLPAGALDDDHPDLVTGLARLRRDCVEAKEALSYDTEVMIPVALPGLHTRVRLTRREFEAMIAPTLQYTVAALRRALRSAGVVPSGLRAILLAGGSSRIPLVSSLVSTAFERPVAVDPHPEHSVALGAARLTAVTTTPTVVLPPHQPAERAADPAALAARPPSQPAEPAFRPEPAALAARPLHPPAEPAIDPEPTRLAARPADWPSVPPGGGAPVVPAAGPAEKPATPDHGRRRPVLLALVAVLLVAVAVPVMLWLARERAEHASGDQAAACGYTDEFDGGALGESWERTRADADVAMLDGGVGMVAPEGADIFDDHLAAPMLLRPVTGDFTVETTLEAEPSIFYQGAGLVLWGSATSYVRLERGHGDSGAIVYEYKNGGEHQRVHGPRTDQNPVVTDATHLDLRLTRTAGTVRAAWRPSGDGSYTDLGEVTVDLPRTLRVGVAVLNRAQLGADPAEFHARFDRVAVTC